MNSGAQAGPDLIAGAAGSSQQIAGGNAGASSRPRSQIRPRTGPSGHGPRLLRSERAGQPEPGSREGALGPVAALSHSRPSAECHLGCGVVLEAAGRARRDGCAMMGVWQLTQRTGRCCRPRPRTKPVSAGARIPSPTMTSGCARTARRTGTSERRSRTPAGYEPGPGTGRVALASPASFTSSPSAGRPQRRGVVPQTRAAVSPVRGPGR